MIDVVPACAIYVMHFSTIGKPLTKSSLSDQDMRLDWFSIAQLLWITMHSRSNSLLMSTLKAADYQHTTAALTCA